MSCGNTIRFALALAACLWAAQPAQASEKELRDCVAAVKAGRPYPGVQPANIDFAKREWRAAERARAIIKALNEQKLEFETMEGFFDPGSANRENIEAIRQDIQSDIRRQTDNLKWLEDGANAVTNQSCAFTQQPQGGAGTSALLEMSGQPVSAAPNGPWTVVAPGQIEQHGYGYDVTYTWSPTLPYRIGPEGFDLTLTVVAQCSKGQRLSTGINLRGGFDFVKPDNTNAATDLPAYCENNSDRQSLTVHVKPAKTYGAGQDVVVTIGAFYGPSVTYHYKPVRTGN